MEVLLGETDVTSSWYGVMVIEHLESMLASFLTPRAAEQVSCVLGTRARALLAFADFEYDTGSEPE
jgi:hypothetical protein